MPLSTIRYVADDLTAGDREKFYANIDTSRGDDACHPWLMSSGSHGYGQMWVKGWGRMTTAHRVAYVLEVGPIEPGMTIDHDRRICEGGICCNWRHLRQLTNVENATDNGQGDKTHCPKGHPYDEVNTFIDQKGWRRCRTCAGARFGRGPTTPRDSATLRSLS